jgi:undecaprenyl-diphosphatase
VNNIKKFWSKYKSYVFLAIIVLLALKVFVPELDSLKESIKAVKDADLSWIIFGQIIFFVGLPILAWQFMVIALKKIQFWLTYRVEMASLFVSKLFPSSLGTFALNFYYLTIQKHSKLEAASVMAINAITSAVAYVFIIVFAIFYDKGSLTTASVHTTINWQNIFAVGGILILIAIASLVLKKVRQAAIKIFKEFFKTIAVYKHRKKAVTMAVFLNFAGSLTSLIALWSSAHALGVEISLSQALVAYVLGNIVGGLVPTPGGIGAIEAGIYSGLLLIGVDSAQAFTVTMIYRFLTYWVPIAPGYYYFWTLKKDVLKSFSLKQSDIKKIGAN